MLDKAIGVHNGITVSNRTKFCEANKVSYSDVVYQRIIYDESRTYHLIAEADNGSTTKFTSEVVADALYTEQENVGLFLPVADCAATAIYDTKRHALAIAHLGRHSTYAKLATDITKHFIHHGSNPEDIIVWMSPHAQKESYKMTWFDRANDPDWQGYFEERDGGTYLDLAGFNRQLFMKQGIPSDNIHASKVDTMVSADYFSHQNGETMGRLALLAVMR